MVKVDKDFIITFTYVNCPLLYFLHHFTAFPYLFAISIIGLNFSNLLIFVIMS